MPPEFIYTSYRLARHYPPDRTVLEDISISFYPGAKIGVIGAQRRGQVQPPADHGRPRRRLHRRGPRSRPASPWATCPRSRSWTRPGTSRATSSTASARSTASSTQYNAVMARWAEPDADYEAIGAEQAALEDRIAAADAWNLERNVDIAMDALRCPPDDADVTHAVRRREASRGAVPAAAQPPGPAAARRADQPPRRRVGRVAGAVPRRSTRAPSSRSPTTGTSSTTSRSGSWSWTAAAGSRSRATTRAGSSRSWIAWRRNRRPSDARQRTLARELEWVRLSPRGRQAKGKARLGAYEQLLAEAQDDEGERPGARDRHPAGPAPGRHGHRGREPAQGLRRPRC